MMLDLCIVTKRGVSEEFVDMIRKDMPVNRVIIETSRPLGMARMRAIQKVETEWFAFVDDDVEIREGWFNELSKYTQMPDVGAVEGVIFCKGLGEQWDRVLNEVHPICIVEIPKDKRWARGYTHNTLIRTELVRDWKPSNPDLQAFEDLELTKHIQNKGYKWLRVPTGISSPYHLTTWKKLRSNAMWHGRSIKYVSLYPRKHKFIRLVKVSVYFARCLFDHFWLKLRWRVRLVSMYQTFFIILGFLGG